MLVRERERDEPVGEYIVAVGTNCYALIKDLVRAKVKGLTGGRGGGVRMSQVRLFLHVIYRIF